MALNNFKSKITVKGFSFEPFSKGSNLYEMQYKCFRVFEKKLFISFGSYVKHCLPFIGVIHIIQCDGDSFKLFKSIFTSCTFLKGNHAIFWELLIAVAYFSRVALGKACFAIQEI